MILSATITCPECGFEKEEDMPENACVYYYRCSQCEMLIKAKPGDCCVFCSYADYPCPPVQISGASCCSGD